MTTMVTPTDEQLKEYADQLPDIYRHVMFAFSELANHPRREGDALTEESIDEFVAEVHKASRRGDAEQAITKLVEREILERQPFDSVCPTTLGERLLAVLTGKEAAPRTIPELPIPSWG